MADKREMHHRGLEEIATQVVAAVGIVGRDEADILIGQGDETAKLLVQAIQAQHTLFLGVLTRVHHMPDTPELLMTFAKQQGVILQIVHNAYAAGIKREREAKNGAERVKPTRQR